MKVLAVILLLFISFGCKKENRAEELGPPFARNTSHDLNYETVSVILKDMAAYSKSVKALDQKRLTEVDKRYQNVLFKTEQKPLFLNVYADPAGSQVVFLLMPKDPDTGSNYLVRYEKNLPVINGDIIELQIRSSQPENPFNCLMKVTDPAAYVADYKSHDLLVRYTFRKQFLQSGTYDFDALVIPSYRQRGYPFIVFDSVKVELIDRTINLTCLCKH